MKSLFKSMISLVATAVLFACSSYPDVNSDPLKNNIAIFRQDALDCAKSYPELSSGAQVKQRIGCMNLKGWH